MTGRKILIVDDDELRCDLLGQLLELEGFEVRIANDGEEGLAAVTLEAFDLILLDLIMPKIDGIRFLHLLPDAVKKMPPVLIISGSVDSVPRETFASLGVVGAVRKPVNPDDLIAKVHACFAGNAGAAPG